MSSLGKAFLNKVLSVGIPVVGGGAIIAGAMRGDGNNSAAGVPPDESQTNESNPAGSDAPTGPPRQTPGDPIQIKLDLGDLGGVSPQRPDVSDSKLTDTSTDPGVEALLQLVGKSMDPRYQAIVGDQNLRRQKELNEQTQQLALEKQMQMDKRLIEQENIRAWRDTYKAQVEANAKLALGTASTIALAMTPNSNFQQQITNAMNSAMGAGKTAGN